jgi:hypothetical protein
MMIKGRDDKIVPSVTSPDQCWGQCAAAPFDCLSFEFVASKSECRLSMDNSRTVPPSDVVPAEDTVLVEFECRGEHVLKPMVESIWLFNDHKGQSFQSLQLAQNAGL